MFTTIPVSFPESFEISHLPKILNQGNIGSCVAHSLRSVVESLNYKETGKYVDFSSGFIYGNRYPGDYTGEGMYPNEALRALCKDGTPSYDRMPINMPCSVCYDYIKNSPYDLKTLGKPQKIMSYVRAYNVDEIKTMLTTMGPVSMMIAVYPSFYNSGELVPNVGLGESVNGYHQITILGWKGSRWLMQNSWGKGWGSGGRALLPMDYKGITEIWGITDMIPQTSEIKMDVPMQLWQGRTMVPIRFVAEALGARFDWTHNSDGKLLVTIIVPPQEREKVIQLIDGNDILKTYVL